MATPITSIKIKQLTPEEIQQEKILELQALLADQKDSINKIFEITADLDDSGILDAVKAMLYAKEDISEIAVNQAAREPVKNLINHVLTVAGMLTDIDPAVTIKLTNSVKSGLNEAELYEGNKQSVTILDLMKALKDPDINRSLKYGLNFLQGMGKGLDEK